MIEKIIEKFEELKKHGACRSIDCEKCKYTNDCFEGEMSYKVAIDNCKAIVQEVAKEYGWVSVKDRLPEVQDEYLVWWTADGFNGKCFYEIVEYHPEEGWIGKIPQAPFGKYTVIAWMPLPSAPYQKGE